MRSHLQQSQRFSATKAQIEYLRAIHKGLPVNTNYATRNRCYGCLSFEGGKLAVRPEIVSQFNLDQ